MKTVRGAAFFVVGILMIAMWLVPAILGSVLNAKSNVDSVRETAPLFMLGMTLMMVLFSGGKAVSFSPAEVDFLFAGPFSRRQLVMYKVVTTGITAMLVSLPFSMWMWRHTSMWIAGYAGIWLAWLFAQSLAMLVVLAKQAVLERGASPVLRIAMLAALVAGAIGVIDVLQPVLHGEFDLGVLASHARDSALGRTLLAPFQVMTHVFTAQSAWPELAQWSAIAAAQCAAVIFLVLQLDGHFVEVSLAISGKVQARLRQFRKAGGGVHAFGASRRTAKWRLPMLPWLGGAGPIAWRQLTTALRNSRGLLFVLVLMALGSGPALWFAGKHEAGSVAPLMIAPAVWLTMLLPTMLRFDFRSDLQHMDAMKSLPVRPLAVALGQVLAPVLVLTIVDCIIVLTAAIVVESIRPWLFTAAGFALPVNLLLIGLENIIFLSFPTRQQMMTPGDFQVVGRNVVISLLKALAMVVALGCVAGASGLVYMLSHDRTISVAAGWVALAAASALTLPVIARLFGRFDPSTDAPE